jgi:hypothetical protein
MIVGLTTSLLGAFWEKRWTDVFLPKFNALVTAKVMYPPHNRLATV